LLSLDKFVKVHGVDPVRNPYTPNAGAMPPVLAGRDAELAAFDILLARLEGGRTEQSMIITGLRGVGKTVLLEEFRKRAEARRWVTLDAEIAKSTPFGPRMAQLVRRGLLQLSPRARWDDRMTRAAGILRSFTVTVSPDGTLGAGLDVDAVAGLGDSGDLAEDLTDVLVAVGEAAQHRDTGVVFLFDELQFLAKEEFESLVAALHKTVQRALPVTVVGAGLPLLPQLSGEAKSYAERLFRFPVIGHLVGAEAMSALVDPAATEGVAFEPGATDHILTYTDGYPYFIQEYGKFVWDAAERSPITTDDALDAEPVIEEHLDASFFRVRADRATDAELRYMRAMAELGSGAQKASDVARTQATTTEKLGPIRARLISKGLLYSPGYGLAAFTVPQFDRFLRRAYPNLLTDPASRARP
jgi:hypothetical protein